MVKIPDFPRFADHDFPTIDDYIEEKGLTEKIKTRAEKMQVSRQIAREMEIQGVTKTEMAALMGTSRAQLNRILDPYARNVTLDTLARAVAALGHHLHIQMIKKAA